MRCLPNKFSSRRRLPRRSPRLAVTPLACRVVPVAGNFIVTNTQNLQVYSPTGQLLSTQPIPTPPGGDTPARDLIVDYTDQTATHVYNGTQAVPFQSSTTDDGKTWDHASGPAGWSTDNANNMGGIAAFDHFVFATDMDVSGDGNGIVRWDLTDNSSERVVSGTDYADLTIGLDGKLYALQPATGSPQVIDVYDPLTLDKLPSVTLPAGPNFTGIAVDKDGRIYAVSWNTPDVWRYSPTGQLQRHRRLQEGELNNLLDIDISDDNRLLIGNDKGFAVRLPVANFIGTSGTTLAHTAYRRFQIKEPDGTDAAGPVFVAWADPQKITLPHVTIKGRKYEDLNANGVRNLGEPGLAGWTIFADLNSNGTLDTVEPSTVTDAQGNYSLDVNLNAQATFRLMEQPQRGWAETFSPTATANDPTAAHPYYTLSFTAGNQANKDFGNHRTDFAVVTPPGGLLTAETGFSASFTVVLTAPPTSDVVIPVSSSNTNEGTVSTNQLVFTPANWNVPQTVTVTGQPDPLTNLPDGNVAYTIDLGPSSSLDPNYDGLSHSVPATNFDSTPVDKVGIVRGLPRRWTLDAFNDGVYTAGRDRRYVKLGAGQTIVGDWNGDGYDDLGLFRPDTGTFTLFVNGAVFKTITRLDGKVGGVPLVGDWNGVPGDEVGLFRRLTGTFVLDADGDGVSNDPDDRVGAMLDGKVGGVPLVGNWDGVGGEEVGLYRPGTGTFTLDRDGDLVSQDPDDTVIVRLAGKVGGVPLVGDWDGDGGTDVGLFFGLTGQWFLDTNGDAQAERTITKLDGAVGGRAVVGDFNGDGITDCGLFRPLTGKWTIDLNHNGVYDPGVDLQYLKVDGLTGGVPLVGKWELP